MNNNDILNIITDLLKKRLVCLKKNATLYDKKREIMFCIETWYMNCKGNKKRIRDDEHDTDDD